MVFSFFDFLGFRAFAEGTGGVLSEVWKTGRELLFSTDFQNTSGETGQLLRVEGTNGQEFKTFRARAWLLPDADSSTKDDTRTEVELFPDSRKGAAGRKSQQSSHALAFFWFSGIQGALEEVVMEVRGKEIRPTLSPCGRPSEFRGDLARCFRMTAGREKAIQRRGRGIFRDFPPFEPGPGIFQPPKIRISGL